MVTDHRGILKLQMFVKRYADAHGFQATLFFYDHQDIKQFLLLSFSTTHHIMRCNVGNHR